MSKNTKSDNMHDAENNNVVRGGLEKMRTYKRRTVVWPASLIVNEFEFKCMLYDISLGGVRLKLDLPLATGTLVQIKIKDFEYAEALVSWYAEAFVGLRFTGQPAYIKKILGEYSESLS